MTTSAWDGRFAIECWEDPNSEEDGHCEYADDIPSLVASAERLIAAGRYRYIELTKYDEVTDDWIEIETFEAD